MDEKIPEKVTLGEAINDLGWFPLLLIGFGGFSILAIIEQSVLRQPLELVLIFQWPLDGYHRVMSLLGAVVEPLIEPAIDWLNTQLNWRLTLDPIWRPLFALAMVFALAGARTAWRDGFRAAAIELAIIVGVGALIGGLLAGMTPRDGSWWGQGLRAGLPIACLVVSLAVLFASYRDDSMVGAERLRLLLLGAGVFGLIGFALAAGLSLLPSFADTAGVVVLGAAVIFVGAFLLSESRNRSDTHTGLTILSGFVAAGLILAADFALKAFGSG